VAPAPVAERSETGRASTRRSPGREVSTLAKGKNMKKEKKKPKQKK
jgi:hypothetical protein